MDSIGQLAENGRVPSDEDSTAPKMGRSISDSSSNGSAQMQGSSTMEVLEIEPHDVDGFRNNELREDVELGAAPSQDDDMEQLLPSSSPKTVGRKVVRHKYCCGRIYAIPTGNTRVICPEYHAKTGFGVVGPHWFGPPCVFAVLVLATYFCIRGALRHLGPVTVATCLGFLTVCTVLLLDVSFRDPGICRNKEIPDGTPDNQLTQWRWCDFCQVYQSPDGVHCPECNVCVAGHDHHCVWMGTCIGKNNYRQFVRFNMSWLYYVAYALFWIATFGPLAYKTL